MPVQRHGFHNPNTKEVVRTSSLNSEKKNSIWVNWELPTWFQEGRAEGPRSLWTRGLPPKPEWQVPPPQEDNPIFLGIWADKEPLSDPELVYGTDASGGPFTADPRLRKVAYAVAACKKQGQDYVQVGAIVGQVPGPQTVFRGEL